MKQLEKAKIAQPQQQAIVGHWQSEWGKGENGFGQETEGSILVVMGAVVDVGKGLFGLG